MSENTLEFDGPSGYSRLIAKSDYSAVTGSYNLNSSLVSNTFCFMNNSTGKPCGILTVGDTLSFEGDVEESAKQFFDFLSVHYSTLIEDAKKTKLVPFDQEYCGRKMLPRETDFQRALAINKDRLWDMNQNRTLNLQHSLDDAMNHLKHGHLVGAAAVLLAIADHEGLIKEGTI